MFLLNRADLNGSRSCFNLNEASSLTVDCSALDLYLGTRVIYHGGEGEDASTLSARFADIIAAYAAEVKVYDIDKEVGYWKPARKSAKKAAAPKESNNGSGNGGGSGS